MRALAIALVIVYHAGIFGFALPWRMQRFGWIGVDLFFVLSGYLIAGQLFRLLVRGRPPDVRLFYGRRALRILPAYLTVVAIYIFLPVLREYERMPPVWKFLTFTQNLGLRGGTAFSHAWSLCIEFQFYLLLPLLVLALARRTRSTGAVLLAVGLLVWGITIRAVLAQVNANAFAPSFGWWQQWIYYATYSRLDPLVIGVSLAAIESFRPKWWSSLMKTAPWIWLPGVAAIVLALFLAEDGLSLISSAFGFFLVALGMGSFLVCAVSPRSPLSRVAVPGAAFLATMAYSLYLSHKMPIHWVERLTEAQGWPVWPAYFLMLALVLVIGCVLFFAVERPFLQIRERSKERKQTSPNETVSAPAES